YLVATSPTQHLRERLCEIFWEGPDDPRAGLRWSLSKIRPIADDKDAPRLVGDRDRVGFEPGVAIVDLLVVRAACADLQQASTETLQRAVSLFRGELLEGLDLADCYRYHAWCVAEREAARGMRLRLLDAVVARLRKTPEAALAFARERVAVD